MTMIREFQILAQAIKFAEVVRGTVITKYDWDAMMGKMVKYYWVRY